ncbi:MAG: PBP1A family penicillin-binding protein [Deltaproteobacteria bacterium]|nr:PBP1A family penicillin-binding protein [Deltaproteobacteria bacterium]
MKLLLKLSAYFFLILIVISASVGIIFWYIWSSNLPYIGSLKEYRPPIISEIYSNDGEIIGRFWDEKRIVVQLTELSPYLIKAFLASEDARFYEHKGVDFMGIARALIKNLTAGRIEQGGSTITQQVARSLLLKNAKKTYRRKAREALLSLQIEKNFSKKRILFLYLNQIYLGHGAYGVEAAARTYFDKTAGELSLAESALLAGLPQAPSRYSPLSHFERAKARQKYVLKRMLENGFIAKDQYIYALNEDLHIGSATNNAFFKAPYFTESIRRRVIEKYGRDTLYRGGIKVYTTLDLKAQRLARDALKRGLYELDKREGYRGPISNLSPEEIPDYIVSATKKFELSPPEPGSVIEALVRKVDDSKNEVIVSIGDKSGRLALSDMKWARSPDLKVAYYSISVKKPSEVLRERDIILVKILNEKFRPPYDYDVSLEQVPVGQGALLCMAPETGKIIAMIGGRDFKNSQFNRATQSRRQPGSAFKPVIFAAALDWGMKPNDLIIDAPYVSDQNSDKETWKPKNYKDKFYGPTLFRTALAESRNVITIKILKKIGINYAINYAGKMGIKSDLSHDLSIALGSSGVSLMEITSVYSVFANGGKLVKPILIERIVDRTGMILEENYPETKKVMSTEIAYVMTDLLKAVIREGTGWRIKALKRPAAGKTGSTNNLRDAWFMGYTPELVTGVWVGYDNQKSMGKGETGSRAASPIWLYFMSDVLKGHPIVDFHVPEGIIFAKIDASTGLLSSPHSRKTLLQAFKEGTEPTEYSPMPKSPKPDQFFQFDMDN